MEDAKVKMEKCKTTLEQMERAQADLVRDIRSVFSGSREELEALQNYRMMMQAGRKGADVKYTCTIDCFGGFL